MGLAAEKKTQPPYDHQEYPAMRYKAAGGDDGYDSCTVHNADEDAALGSEWVKSPAELAEDEDKARADGEAPKGKGKGKAKADDEK